MSGRPCGRPAAPMGAASAVRVLSAEAGPAGTAR